MAQALSGTAAFCYGYTVGRRTRRYWSPREALASYPGIDVDAFLNGADDGARGDNWRYNQIRQAEQNKAAA